MHATSSLVAQIFIVYCRKHTWKLFVSSIASVMTYERRVDMEMLYFIIRYIIIFIPGWYVTMERIVYIYLCHLALYNKWGIYIYICISMIKHMENTSTNIADGLTWRTMYIRGKFNILYFQLQMSRSIASATWETLSIYNHLKISIFRTFILKRSFTYNSSCYKECFYGINIWSTLNILYNTQLKSSEQLF